MYSWSGVSFRRPRSVWFAFGTGLVCCIAVAALVLAPILSLIGASVGPIPVVVIPVVRISVAVIGGYALSAGLLALSVVSRHGAVSWLLAIAAVICALVVSVYPAVAVALVAVNSIGEVIPFITEWIDRIRNTI